LHVSADEPGPLQREDDAGDVERLAVGEDVALREGPTLDAAVPQPRDAVVEQSAAGPEHRGELLAVAIDLRLADVLDHADRGRRAERLTGQLAVVLHADLAPAAQAGLGDPPASLLGLGLR